jgi:hypothetical protein
VAMQLGAFTKRRKCLDVVVQNASPLKKSPNGERKGKRQNRHLRLKHCIGLSRRKNFINPENGEKSGIRF